MFNRTIKSNSIIVVLLISVVVILIGCLSGCSFFDKKSEDKSTDTSNESVNNSESGKKEDSKSEDLVVTITEQKNTTDTTSDNSARTSCTVRYPIFEVKTKGYDMLENRLEALTFEYKADCEKFFEESKTLMQEAEISGDREEDVLFYESRATLCTNEVYSFYTIRGEHYNVNGTQERHGYALDAKTGSDIPITYFISDRARLAEMLKQNFDVQYGKYNIDKANQFFDKLKTDNRYIYNYYVTENEIVVFIDGGRELGTSRNISNIELRIPRDNIDK